MIAKRLFVLDSGAVSTQSDRVSMMTSGGVSRHASVTSSGGNAMAAATASTSPTSLHTSSEQHDSFDDFDEDVVDAAPLQPVGTCVALYPFDGTSSEGCTRCLKKKPFQTLTVY